jgi:integrase
MVRCPEWAEVFGHLRHLLATGTEDRKSQVNTVQSDLSNESYEGSSSDGLDASSRARLARVVPPNTAEAYRYAFSAFEAWCFHHGLPALPAAEATLTRYTSAMCDAEYAPATVGQHIGAIRTMHRRSGFKGQPVAEDALDILRGYKRELAENGIGQKQAIPISPDVLRRMIGTLDLSTLSGQRDRLALVLGFLGMLRRSELVRLRVHDASVTEDGVSLLIRTSKTDKESRGRRVPIPPQRDPDPVDLTRRWLALVHDGFLMRRISRSDELLDEPWRPAGVCDVVKRCARVLELPNADRYTAHSLRAGGLTASLRAGKPLGVAARHGGWNPESAMPARYARVADEWKDNAMEGIL